MTSLLPCGPASLLRLPVPDAAELAELIGWLDVRNQRERDDLAADVHDQLGSSLTALAMRLAMVARQSAVEPNLAAQWSKANGQLTAISATVRRLQKQLRPVAIEALGLQAALADYLAQFALRLGLRCNLRFEANGVALSLPDAAVLFRIIEAALANIEHHAKARNVTLNVDHLEIGSTSGWHVTLADDGIGFDAAGTTLRATQGLRLMQVRAASIGMTLTLYSVAGQGCMLALGSTP